MQTEISLGMQAALRVGRLIDEDNFVPEMISLIKEIIVRKLLRSLGQQEISWWKWNQ